MATKQRRLGTKVLKSSVLAKIFMVTKLIRLNQLLLLCSVLAKIHMVTKPQKYGNTFLNVIEY